MNDRSSEQLVMHLFAYARARLPVDLSPSMVTEEVCEILEELEVTTVPQLTLAGFGTGDAVIDFFVSDVGVAVILDVDPAGPDLVRIARCSRPPLVRELAVLTIHSPDLYPTSRRQRDVLHGKPIYVVRLPATSRYGGPPGPQT